MMKIQIKEKNGLNLPLYMPNRLLLMLLRRKKVFPATDIRRIERMLHRYHGFQLAEVKDKDGTEVKIRL